jgi:auxin efflux carrier family protein
MSTGLGESFLAAVQASLSVLLVISYGGLAAYLGLLNPSNTKAISKVCVRLFLPALLLTKIGSQLHSGSAARYGIILLWAIVCHLVSFLIGIAAHFWFGMPDWTTVALMFNNTTSYPLLLISALEQTGILKSLIVNKGEGTEEAVERAKSYFLVFATVSSCLTFAVGPRLIDSEHAPEQPEKHESQDEPFDAVENYYANQDNGTANETTGLLAPPTSNNENGLRSRPSTISFAENAFWPSRRETSRAATPAHSPERARRSSVQLQIQQNRRSSIVPKKHWYTLSPRAKWWALFVGDFFNAPLLGALLGAVIGLVPALHRAFFNDTYEGGIFTAWFTASLRSIGQLFVPLPVVVAGVSLYTAMAEARKAAKEGKSEKRMPWGTVSFIMVVRFVVWPLASIALVYVIAERTGWLGEDPMLWFALMLMVCSFRTEVWVALTKSVANWSACYETDHARPSQ